MNQAASNSIIDTTFLSTACARPGPLRLLLRPSIAVLLLASLTAAVAMLAAPNGAQWFVHSGMPTDAPIFFAIAHEPDFGVPQLQALHIPVGLAYRYQRILYPLLGRLFGLFQPGLAASGLVVANVLAGAAGVEVLSRYAKRHCASVAWGWLFAGSLGFLVAFSFDLSDGLLWMLSLAALLCYEQRRIPPAAAILMLALFTKETALIIVVVLGFDALRQRRWSEVAWLSLPVALFAVYQVLLRHWFGQLGFTGSQAQLDFVPFLSAYQEPPGAGLPPKHLGEFIYLTLTVVAPAVVAACWSVWRLRQRYDAVAAALVLTCLQVALMSSWSWTGFVHYSRLSMGVPLLLAWMALRERLRWMRAVVIVQAVAALIGLAFIGAGPL